MQRRTGLLKVTWADRADLAVVTQVPGDDVPGNDVAAAVDAGLAEQAPHVLGAGVVVVGADEARASRSVGAAAGVLKQQQDRRLDTRLGRIEPRHGAAVRGAEPSDKGRQRR